MARRSLQASLQGIQDIKKALKRKKWSQTYIAGAVGCSRQTIWSLLQGKPTDCDVFMEVCAQLGLNWEEIAEPELPEPEQNDSQDIDVLVREVRSHCGEAILDNYSKIRLPDDTRIDVDLLYVDVYVLEKLSSKRYASISGLLEGVEQREDYERLALGQRQERLPGQEIVQQFPRLMVLGKPGSGKTTFLRHLAVDCSKGKFFCDRIPVLIELRSIKEGNSFNLLNLIHREFGLPEQEQTQQILNLGKAFILLDGLDEVASQLRQSVRDQIYEFAKEYRKNRFVLTCRTQTIEYIADNFEPIEVANFDAEQVKIFALNWFTATPETSGEAERWTSRFVGKLEENQQIRELAITPILLTLTCLLFIAEQDLPKKQSELYEKASNLLLNKWDKFRDIPRDYQQLSVSDKQKLLSYLAFRKFEQPDNFILFEQDEIQGYIAEHLGIEAEESETVLKAIEAHHGLLIEQAQGIWSFSHLTFQEYFAAKYIVDSSNPEAEFQRLLTHVTQPRWRELFLLTVSMVENANKLLMLMKQKQEEIGTSLISDKQLKKFLGWVNTKASSVKVPCKFSDKCNFYFALVHDFPLARYLAGELGSKPDIQGHDDNIFNYDLAYRHLYELYLDLSLTFTLYSENFEEFRRGIEGCHSDFSRTPKLHQALEHIKIHLPRIEEDFEKFFDEDWQREKLLVEETFWQANGQTRLNELRTVMIEHRNIGHDWQLSEEQKEQLKRYYDANKLLMDCLNSGNVTPKVREEIEKILFAHC
ncbi:NACHT domain-containing NTPase [Microcoleus sp. FACHB-SPT15]|uniref:NACHT domain-containing protein n=1 Tax=Microcoleus sp. FACHB-SPT15 TaxID=2692830 RepID=UPI00177E20D8|nr:NACHT domain-containing NTPase [Microcoleus sp. FACHB-SPT15]MBD1807264.1 NACHT domain-containing NTPase [Microcoleus sp. FACHB-SPT15]